MEKRINMKQYVDMDELSCPWESNNVLVTPVNNAIANEITLLSDYIKNIKNEVQNSSEKGLKLVKKNERI